MVSRKSVSTRPIWFTGGRAHRLYQLFLLALRSRKRPVYDYDVTRILVFLLSRDLYSNLASIIDKCTSAGVLSNNICILDLGTSSDECKAAYRSYQLRGINVVSVPKDSHAFGPYVVWLDKTIYEMLKANDYPYIVSDADLRFPDAYPDDWLQCMFCLLNVYKLFTKVSLPLKVDDIDVDNRLTILRHESLLGSSLLYSLLRLFSNLPSNQRVCQTDTTFSLYRPGLKFSTLSLRIGSSYEIYHMPWYKSFVDTEEYKFYQVNKRPEFGMWS